MSKNVGIKIAGLVAAAMTMSVACSPKETAEIESAEVESVEEHTHSHPASVSNPDHSIEESTIRIENGIIRTPLGGKNITSGYFAITLGSDDKIIAASSDIAESIELHEHTHQDGVMQMRKLDHVEVNANQETVFKPKGLHLMLFGVNDVQEGDVAEVIFSFESGRSATASFEISVPDVSHGAGHKH